MRLLSVALITALAVIATIILYEPATIAFFKLTEPYFASPVKGDMKNLTIRNDALGEGEYGAKRRNGRFHAGVDILASVGTPVYASKSGLAFFGNVPTGYGKYVMIRHPDGTQTFYGHLSDWYGKAPRRVNRGELIGFVGKTGNAANKLMQPHLHFEIRKDGEPVDPRGLIR